MLLTPPQVFNVQHTLDVMLAQPARDLQRLRHARSRRVRCHFATDLGHGRARGPVGCTVRLYRKRNLHGLVAVIPMDVTLVARHRRITFEDGSGWATYSAKRSLAFNPMHHPRLVARLARMPRYIGG